MKLLIVIAFLVAFVASMIGAPIPGLDFDPEEDIIFYLFTKESPDQPEVIEFNDLSSLRRSSYNSNRPTRVIIHGFSGKGLESSSNVVIIPAYLKAGDFNLLVVDWMIDISIPTIQREVFDLVDDVAFVIARFIDWLYLLNQLRYNDVYLVGSSLGAHVAGSVGQQVKYGRINTIFVADPSDDFFYRAHPDNRLSVDDADYVEAIHTNIGVMGYAEPTGHADFYPNGGVGQPGCDHDRCDHLRANDLLSESLWTDVGFWAIQCENYEQILSNSCVESGPRVAMGGDPSNRGRASGVYYLTTNAEEPFAQGLESLNN